MATISFARGAPSLDIVDVEGLREAAQLAFDNDPAGTTAYGTSVGYVPLREWIAEQHGVAVEQVLVTNGSMQADAFLFELLVQPGDAVIVESPTYDRTLLNLRARGADVRMVDLETDGISIEGLETVLSEAVHPKLAHIIPNFQNPAGYTLSAAKRKRLLELAVEHDFTIFEDDPYVVDPLRGRAHRLDVLAGRRGPRGLRLLVLEDGLPGHPRRLPGRPAGDHQADPDARDQHVHLAEHGRPVDREPVRPLRADGRRDRHGQERAARPPRRGRHRARSASCPRRSSPRRRAATSCGSSCAEGVDVAELEKAAAERDVLFVKGTDFLLEGGQNTLRLAYSGVTPEQIDEGITKLAEAVRSLGVPAA